MTKTIVYSPIELSATEKKTISSYLASKHGLEGAVEIKIDKSVIAGIRIVHADQEIDLSVAGALERLSEEIA